MGTYGAHCSWCDDWACTDLPTLEQVERAYLAHVRAEHPDHVATAVDAALDGRCQPRFNFDTILVEDGYQTTCSRCEDTLVSDDVSVNDNWPAVHAPVCPRRWDS